ncbi:cell adhesion molecule-related/down-regulated by oncogenes-like isoform X2 [Saccostrea echinata]|uniref:cell adhesion molecule-related/down-regulated by oncogenes-like isoform X2 n=1 Tax=Saccostrea echinata TaxID=191078 RepID=UPI002A80E744|nr:cell adhesion molecule-related/down-regulated by oncogenes-like isoform X2 [Saccostrea echinata]
MTEGCGQSPEAARMKSVLSLILVSSCLGMVPQFLEEPESMAVAPQSPVTLPCRVSDPQSTVVQWKFNGDFVKQNDARKFQMNGTNLYIQKFRHRRKAESSEGIYECIATNEAGSLASKPARLSKAALKPFKPREDLHLTVMEGLNINLPCEPPASNPPANILFSKNGSTIITGKSRRFQVFADGSMMIRNASLGDSGQYRCVAVNPVTLRNRTANHVVHLKVLQSAQEPLEKQPAIILSSTTIRAGKGEDTELECAADGSPPPNITWDRYGGRLAPDRHIIQNGNLHIFNLTQADEGTYLCSASNGVGTVQVKAMELNIEEPPSVTAKASNAVVNAGESVHLVCEVKGEPVPDVIWYHNAVPVTDLLKAENGVTTYSINSIRKSQGGIYQCMSSNEAGMAYSAIEVEVKGQLASENEVPDNIGKIASGGVISGGVDTSPKMSRNGNRRRKKGKRKRKRKKGGRRNNRNRNKGRPSNDGPTVKLVPPSAPDVVQLSDTSVKLNWTVPENDGLSITFFRIQYRAIKPKKTQWKTEDTDVRGDQRMYELIHLKQEGTYKFRVAAVYSNNDNKHGPTSKKFTLKTAPYSEPQAPEGAPVIVEVKAVEFQKIHGLNVKWNYVPKKKSPIEGFTLHYKEYGAKSNFTSLPLLEPTIRSYMIQDLKPATEYTIKIQSFNTAGYSDLSNEVVMRTKGGVPFQPPPGNNGRPISNIDNDWPSPAPPTPSRPSSNAKEQERNNTQSSSEMLYMVLGIVLGVMMLFLIIFMFMCWWKQRQQRRRMDAMNDAVCQKFQDSSQRIYADSLHKKYPNGGGFGCNGVNGAIPNGHAGNAYTRMNISVNPLSDIDVANHNRGSNYQTSTFVPNGSVPSHYNESDNNFNKINRSMDGSVHSTSHHSQQCIETLDSMGGGEAPACPPSPHSCHVPTGFNSDFNSDSPQESYSHGGRDPHLRISPSGGKRDIGVHYSCDSLTSEGGANSGKPKRRRKRASSRDHGMRDQATNTDLSSNEGTIEFTSYDRTLSSSQISGQNSFQPQTLNSSSPNSQLMQSNEEL